ncbi:MAG: sulfotransferase [Deltaproteobacteria bacterium]|nr:sulfotransferase [Deltaproteobacteria bacterium]
MDPGLDRPPIIIGGCGRSGTSLLLSVLSALPGILAIPHETEAFCPTAWGPQLDLNAPFETKRIEDYLASRQRPASNRRWCEKSPKNILFFGRILAHFKGDVRLINIVRDGRDVITSYHPTRRREKPWVSPERWIGDVSAGLEFDDHPQVHLVRYEDLILNFESTLRGLCRFLEEEFPRDFLSWRQRATVRRHVAWPGQVQNLHQRSIGRWQDPAHQDLVADFLARPQALNLLRHYGYLD